MYHGIIPPLVTPLNNACAVDEGSVRRLVSSVAPCSSAFMPTLSSGEGWALNDTQLRDMVTYTKRYANGKPVLAGVLAPTTDAVVSRAQVVMNAGADAIVITTPFGKNIAQEEIVRHFTAVKKGTDNMPLWIYNEELISGNAITLETMKKIVDLGNVVGIKEASGSAAFTAEVMRASLGVPIFQGWENLCFESRGVDGYVLPLANIEPQLCFDMFKNPTKEKQQLINNACTTHNLLEKNWYAELKKELQKREVITTALTAS